VIKALRYFGRVSASAAAGLLETLLPRRKSPVEEFFALDSIGQVSRPAHGHRGPAGWTPGGSLRTK